tara:strand:- start:601 stop:918 length:318 start_codon:yes stop_codon:yes gene_type:complete
VTSKEDIMKITVLGTLFAGLLALNPAQAGSIDLLAIWSSDGVDSNDSNADQVFCDTSKDTCLGTIIAGDIGDITATQFYGKGGNTAQDTVTAVTNMLTFEGIDIL